MWKWRIVLKYWTIKVSTPAHLFAAVFGGALRDIPKNGQDFSASQASLIMLHIFQTGPLEGVIELSLSSINTQSDHQNQFCLFACLSFFFVVRVLCRSTQTLRAFTQEICTREYAIASTDRFAVYQEQRSSSWTENHMTTTGHLGKN